MAEAQPKPQERPEPEKRAKMVGWYDPPRLVAIAIRVAISTIFGQFADRRESLTSRAIEPYNYAKDFAGREFWLDFVADCGDGWNPTYAVARLLAKPVLELPSLSEKLPRAHVVVMGGDEVYPTASRKEYEDRLVAPYDAAKEQEGGAWPDPKPHLYAIPGNHDWYDSLVAFLDIFCRRRVGTAVPARDGKTVGGRETQQTRSYFAAQLPHNWWLWGADIQLSGYIDQPQIDFFARAAELMEPGSRLIICTGEPEWAYLEDDSNQPGSKFRSFSYLTRLPALARRGHRVCLVLTGDSHHYSRYVEADCQFITWGGGGAFLHPTHQLADAPEILSDYPRPNAPPEHEGAKTKHPRRFALQCAYPDKSRSRRLAWWNWAFAGLNWRYAVSVALGYMFFSWLLHAHAAYERSTLSQTLASPNFIERLGDYAILALSSPWPAVLVVLMFVGYWYLADFRSSAGRVLAGVVHGLVQLIVFVVLTCLLAPIGSDLALIPLAGVLGGALSATILGIYFQFCLRFFRRHWNEAFSSLRIEGCKGFLRLRIKPEGTLAVYPIGLDEIPRESSSGPLTNPPLQPHLIEEPILIR